MTTLVEPLVADVAFMVSYSIVHSLYVRLEIALPRKPLRALGALIFPLLLMDCLKMTQ